MFRMKVNKQMNMRDRTLIAGEPTFDSIPSVIIIDSKEYKVLGVSQGIKPPFVSLEIERTESNLENKTATV